jgi:lipopolysaccharide biosynthesis glycosyltransferase
MKANVAHVLLCGNAAYVQHIAVCLTSLFANNPGLFFEIVFVGRANETIDETKLRQSLRQFPNYRLTVKAFTPPADQILPLAVAHYTLDTWTRLWVGEFFPENVDRVLYIDGDIVILGDVAPLWNTDLEGALLGTVDIPGSQAGVERHGLRPEDGYFNAGVLLIDLAQWRSTDAMQETLKYVATYPERVHDVDQDALNACFHARRKRLAYKWNVIWPFFREPPTVDLPRSAIETIRKEACIVHYNGASKPWSYFCDHPLKSQYEKYLRMTEWRDFVPPDRTLINRIRKTISAVLPEPSKKVLKRAVSYVRSGHHGAPA